MHKTYNKFLRAFGVSFFAETILSLKGLVLIPILTKSVGALNYGIWSQVIVTVSMLSPLVTLGLPEAAARFLPGASKQEAGKQYYSILIVIFPCSLLAYIFIVLFSGKMAELFFGGSSNAVFIRFGALMLVTSVMKDTLKRYFKIFLQIKTFSLLNILEGFGVVIVTATLIKKSFGIWAPVISMTCIDAAIILISSIIIFKQIGPKRPELSRLKKYFSFGLPIVPIAWFLWIANLSDRYFLGFFYGPSVVGKYSIAYTLAVMSIGMIFAPLFRVFSPFIAERWNNSDTHAVKNIAKHSIRYSIFLAVPAIFILSQFGRPLINILSTPDFAQAASILPLICLGYTFLQISSFYESMISLSNKTKYFLFVFGLTALINVTLNFILIPRFSMMGAAIATCLSFFIHMFLHILISRKLVVFEFDLFFLIKSLVSIGLTLILLAFFKPVTIFGIFISALSGFLFYSLSMFIMGALSKGEIVFALSTFKKQKLI